MSYKLYHSASNKSRGWCLDTCQLSGSVWLVAVHCARIKVYQITVNLLIAGENQSCITACFFRVNETVCYIFGNEAITSLVLSCVFCSFK